MLMFGNRVRGNVRWSSDPKHLETATLFPGDVLEIEYRYPVLAPDILVSNLTRLFQLGENVSDPVETVYVSDVEVIREPTRQYKRMIVQLRVKKTSGPDWVDINPNVQQAGVSVFRILGVVSGLAITFLGYIFMHEVRLIVEEAPEVVSIGSFAVLATIILVGYYAITKRV